MKTVHQAILHGEQILQATGVDQPRWNAERLLLLALQQDRSKIYADLQKQLTPGQWQSYSALLSRRAEHYPLAYLEGTQEFFGREFLVNENVLIPRPETEGIIEQVLSLPLPEQARVIDLGSGSGNVPLTLALELPHAFVAAVEISAAAIDVLKENARRLCGSGGLRRLLVVGGDLYHPPFRAAAFDVVTCNPPYVEDRSFSHLPAETRWEPRVALTTARSLENVYQGLFSTASHLLRPGGYLVFEIGFGQLERIVPLCKPPFTLLAVGKDRQDIPRTLALQKQP